ncbi:MAG: flagellar hook-basal body complex protein FliE [Desulfotomaculum sp.]|nr:flagellar hook-basal body complex protein FliE [Desulfotomaculum sp.]
MQIKSLPQPVIINEQTQANGSSEKNAVSFGEVLNNAVKNLNETQLKAEEIKLKFVTGEVQDIHQVTIAMQEAKIAMDLAVEVRNKLLEAYQELSRMPL